MMTCTVSKLYVCRVKEHLGDLNANALPPMSPPNHRRPVRQIPYASAAVLRQAQCPSNMLK